MVMMPGLPKRNPARRNKSATKATLSRDHNMVAPDLPDRGTDWHELTVKWWADVWASPMAPEYDDSDLHGLYLLAELVDAFWLEGSTRAKGALAAEIRLQRQCFGLSPIDRRRLQWEIERGESAEERGRRRRNAAVTSASEGSSDPYAALRSA